MLLHFGAGVKLNHYAAHSQRQISQFVTLSAVGAVIVVESMALGKNLRAYVSLEESTLLHYNEMFVHVYFSL